MHTLIDSPLTMFSTKKEIEIWLKALGDMEQTPEVIKEKNKCKKLGDSIK